jgi:hypothetical protein
MSLEVPEAVRSYFATAKNICLYAWFSYDLYSVVQFLCYTTVEMALKKKFPVLGKDRRGLSHLLKEAVDNKLIKDKGFSHIRVIRQNLAERLRNDRKVMRAGTRLRKSEYADSLATSLPYLRNAFAHPRMHQIVMPEQAKSMLRITAELVNQLFV